MDRYVVKIRRGNKLYIFMFRAEKSVRARERLIERSFYKEHNEKLLKNLTHHEIMIVDLPKDLRNDGNKYHIHTSKLDSIDYVCWTGQMGNLDHAQTVIKLWTLGSVYHHLNSRNFTELPEKEEFNGDDLDLFSEKLMENLSAEFEIEELKKV
jgi:hypothetical protein